MLALNSMTPDGVLTYDWDGNKYLQYLLNIRDDKNYWANDYNTNLRYSELGKFAVFLMEIDGGSAQSHFYVTYASHTGNYEDGNGNGDGNDNDDGHAPEPTTLLLWTFGGIGALGFRHYCKRSAKE